MVPLSVQTLEAQLNAVVGHLVGATVDIDSVKREIYLPKQFSKVALQPNALLTWL